MKITSCPVCKFNDIDVRRDQYYAADKTYVFRIVECPSCGHFFTYFLEDADINQYYDGGDYTVRDTRKSIFHRIQEIEYNKVLNTIGKLNPARSLLDFGSGKGVFLSFAKKRGYQVVGVETSKPRANYTKDVFGIEVSTGFFSGGMIFGKRYPVITMFHVLEHIPDITIFPKQLYDDNLSAGGLIVIEVPNFGSWQSKWAKGRWLHIDAPRHISHFTEKSLEKIINNLNLEVIKKETYSLHLGIIGMIQTLLSFGGYKGFLIGDLKEKKSPSLKIKVLFLLPFAFILEGLSALAGKGGVLRYYLQRKKEVA
jgi:SAM-dependent methyltransferase